MIDSAFVVRDIDTNRHAIFVRGRAKLATVTGNRVRLEISPRYPGVVLESRTYRARAVMTLTADCRGKWHTDLFKGF